MKYGDRIEHLTEIECFKDRVPLYVIRNPDVYDGIFASRYDPKWVVAESNYEINGLLACSNVYNDDSKVKEFRAEVDALRGHKSLSDLFWTCLDNQDLDDAWAYLNSFGWTVKDAKKALEAFVKLEGSDFMHALCDHWCNLKKERWLKSY